MRDDSGAVIGAVMLLRDVTHIKKTEKTLQELVAREERRRHTMEVILNSMADGVVVADQAGEITFANPAAQRIAGTPVSDYTAEEWPAEYGYVFRDGATPIPPNDLPLARAIRGEAVNNAELMVRNPRAPEARYISANATPLLDESQRPGGGSWCSGT